MALEAVCISLEFGGQEVEALGVLGLLPFQELVEVAGRTLFRPDEILVAGRFWFGLVRLALGNRASHENKSRERNSDPSQMIPHIQSQHFETSRTRA
jgi:hypothetical protein